jgi:hypothetical protein
MHAALGVGVNICPRGYILALDPSSVQDSPRLGHCTLCSAGTYSINPLFGERFLSDEESGLGVSESPRCLACPAGGVCLGGDKVCSSFPASDDFVIQKKLLTRHSILGDNMTFMKCFFLLFLNVYLEC